MQQHRQNSVQAFAPRLSQEPKLARASQDSAAAY